MMFTYCKFGRCLCLRYTRDDRYIIVEICECGHGRDQHEAERGART